MKSEHHKLNTGNSPVTLRAINAWNEQFWAKQARLTLRRIANPLVFHAAKRDMDSEAIRVAFRERKSLDEALADAEVTIRAVRKVVVAAERQRAKSICRSGGLARKSDALQILIEQLVQDTAEISQRDLLHQLKREQGQGTITTIDGKEIQFRTFKGKLKSAPISGLKDRLHRAKNKNRFALTSLRE